MARAKKPNNDAESVRFRKGYMVVKLKDGRILSTPLSLHKPLDKATPAQRRKFKLFGGGFAIEWPDLDYDVCVRQLLVRGGPCCD